MSKRNQSQIGYLAIAALMIGGVAYYVSKKPVDVKQASSLVETSPTTAPIPNPKVADEPIKSNLPTGNLIVLRQKMVIRSI